ncbi:hypothetical protein ACP275_12G165800 [Erythranthe tilingii]
MESYLPLKLKRKDLEDVNDDFSDFSLSSPARKIRRLDAELPPIIEEEESEVPISLDYSMPHEQSFGFRNSSSGVKIEELPSNDERAIVLFKPNNPNPLLHYPSNFSVSVNPNFISVFNNQVLQSGQSNSWKLVDVEEAEDNNSGSGDRCLAVVPWVPSQLSSSQGTDSSSQIDNCECEMMDVQDMEETKMEVEDATGINQMNVNGGGGISINEGFHQWQQHCFVPQPPQNTTAPIVWYR